MKINELLLKNRYRLLLYSFGALISSISGVIGTIAIARAFGLIELSNSSDIIKESTVIILLGISPPIIHLVSRYMRIGFMRDILFQVRMLAYNKIMSLTIEEYNRNPIEHYVSRLVSDINLFEKDFFLSFFNILYSSITFFIGILILNSIDTSIALITVGVTIFLYIVSLVFEKPVRQTRSATEEANAEYNLQISNILNGMEVIKLYDAGENFKVPFYWIINLLEEIKGKYSLFKSISENITIWICTSYQILMCVYSAYLMSVGKIGVSGLLMVFNITGMLIWGLRSGFGYINTMKAALDVYKRIVLYEIDSREGMPYAFEREYCVSGLYYSYDKEPVLEDVTISYLPKDKVLIFGPSGTGKTTLLGCMSGRLTDYRGSICVDGIEIRDIDLDEMMKGLAYIGQYHFMFNESIKYNIILEREYDENRLREVLESVDLLEWVDSLNMGVEHILTNNGSNISGGQRQRISIARELYSDSDMLFIDEPSASLDDETAYKVYETILSLDKTIVCVSHRHLGYLSQEFDKVIDLGAIGGRRVEEI